VTECQGCGAWNESHRALCVLCGTPLAATDEWEATAELPPLPPLPDGGLGSSMPSWLRDVPVFERVPPEQLAVPALLGSHADPRSFLNDDDFPQWLRDLAIREPRRPQPEPAAVPEQAIAAPAGRRSSAPVWPGWPEAAADAPSSPPAVPAEPAPPVTTGIPAPAATEPDTAPVANSRERHPAAVIAAQTLDESSRRGAWETLLLVLLFLGIVVAALWALVANGVFSPSV
jgi:hypothetical protein